MADSDVDMLSMQIRSLALAIVTGGHRLTNAQADALADLAAACGLVARGDWPRAQLTPMSAYTPAPECA